MPIQITGKFTPSGGAGAFNLLDIADLEAAGTWKLLYVNGSNEVIELSLGADGTFLQANGVAAAPTFAALVDGDIPATHSGSAHHAQSHDHSASGDGQTLQPLLFRFNASSELTIATGAITVTGNSHTLDTEADAAYDLLSTINGGTTNGIYRF